MSRLKTFLLVLLVSMMLSLFLPVSHAQDTAWHIDATLGYGKFRQVVWKPDGIFFAVASDASVQIYSPDMQVVAVIHERNALAVAWQPGGTQMAIATTDGIVIWDVSGGDTPQRMRDIPPGVLPMAWSPDGQWLAFADEEAQIWLRNAETGSTRVAFREHSFTPSPDSGDPSLSALAWSPNSARIASSAYITSFYIWDAQSGEVEVSLGEIRTHSLGSIVWLNETALRVLNLEFGGGMAVSWIENGSLVETKIVELEWGRGVMAAAYSPDANYLAVWTEDHALRLLDGATLEDLDIEYAIEPSEFVQSELNGSLAWHPDGQTIITGATGTIFRWHIEAEELTLVDTIDDEYMGWLNALAWSPDGERLASVHGFVDIVAHGDDNRLRMWDPAQHTLLWRTTGDNGPMLSLAWREDGQVIATGHFLDAAFFRLWNSPDGEHVADAPEGGGSADIVAFIPGSDTMVVSYSGTLLTYDMLEQSQWESTDALWQVADGQPVEADSLAISADGKFAVSDGHPSQPDDITVWTLADGSILATLEQGRVYTRDNKPMTLALSPDGKWVAVSEATRSISPAAISIYEVATGKRVHVLRGHEGGVTQLAWSPDSMYLASSSRDGTARLWDTGEGEALAVLVDTGGMLSSAAWSPDGKTIAVGALNGVIYLLRQG